jgi:hypothetical protein
VPALNPVPEAPLVFEREVRIDNHEFLRAHVIDGKAVVPAALMIEWLGHGALHGNPGLRFLGLDDLRVFKGVILGEGEAITVRVGAERAEKQNGHFVVATELTSVDATGRRVLHAHARILLANSLAKTPDAAPPPVLAPYQGELHRAYGEQLFHGAELQGLTEIDGCDDRGIVAMCASAPAPREWIEQPLRSRWITDPLAIDCGFQMMILWSFALRGVGSLPTEVQSYRQFVAAFPSSGARIEVRVTNVDPNRATADIDWLDASGTVLARMTGYQCVLDASLNDAFLRNHLDSRDAARQ